MLGMYSEATAAHPYSQAANLALGAHETGFLLGYIPSQVSYTAIKEDAHGRRQSVALFWLATNPRAAARRCTRRPGTATIVADDLRAQRRSTARSSTLGRGPGARGRDAAHDHRARGPQRGHGRRRPRSAPTSSPRSARCSAEQADRAGTSCTSSSRSAIPATAALPMAVHDELGVFFGGIVPELRDGDVLRLQWLNGVEADPSDVAVASDFGARAARLRLRAQADAPRARADLTRRTG